MCECNPSKLLYRDTVMMLMRDVDRDGVIRRGMKKLARRVYSSKVSIYYVPVNAD